MFHVVETIDGACKEVDVIPDNWMLLEESMCYWPPNKNVSKLVAARKEPDPKWRKYNARILKSCDSLTKALSYRNRAQYTSDLNSEAEDTTPKRKRLGTSKRQLPINEPASSESEEESESTVAIASSNQSKLPPAPPTPAPPMTALPMQPPSTPATKPPAPLTPTPPTPALPMPVPPKAVPTMPAPTLPGPSLSGPRFVLNENHIFDERSVSRVVEEEGSVAVYLDASMVTTPAGPASTAESRNFDKYYALLQKIAEDVAVIKGTVMSNSERIKNLERGYGPPASPVRIIPPTPIKSIESFMNFEEKLTEENQTILKDEMLLCGGDTVSEICGRILRKLIADQLAVSYSLKGQKGNMNFSKTKTWDVMKEAVLSCKRIARDEKVLEKATGDWFRHATDRIKAKSARKPTSSVPSSV